MPSHTANKTPNSRNKTTNSSPPTAPAYPHSPGGYERGPARVDAITAMLRYPLLVIIPVVVLAVLGWVLAGKKHPSYKAEAQVLIGQPSPGTSGELPGVVQAEQALAGIYAREIDFNQVLVPLAHQFNTSPGVIASRLSAAPDPQSPLVRIFATAPNASDAVALANSASAKFAATVNSLTQTSPAANHAFGSYQKATAAYQRALAKQHDLQHQLFSRSPNASAASDPALLKASAATQIAQLHQSTLANQYQNLLAAQQNAPTLSVFESAAGAASNHASNLEIYVFGGVVAGLVIGAALATLLANRRNWQTSRAV